MEIKNKYDNLFEPGYCNAVTGFLKDNVPVKEGYRILEVGCNKGYNLESLQNYYPKSYTVGLDILPIENLDNGVDEFYCVDIEHDSLSFKENSFDIILCADVLEHLNNPLGTLKKLYPYLKEEGYLIASIPNLMHFSVLHDLLVNGNFTYTNTGLLDSDHKHFFTFNEIERLFNNAKFNTEIFAYDMPPKDFRYKCFIDELRRIRALPEHFYTAYEYYILARKV